MSVAFMNWLSAHPLRGPDGLVEDVPKVVLGELDRFIEYLGERDVMCFVRDVPHEIVSGYIGVTPVAYWSLYLYFMYFERYDVLPLLSPWFINEYSRSKTVYDILPHLGLDTRLAAILKARGIHLASELLYRVGVPERRIALAFESGIPERDLLLITKGCDISRMMGMLGQAMETCLGLGLDTLDAFRNISGDALRDAAQAYLESHGMRINPMVDYGWFPAEARKLPDLVAY